MISEGTGGAESSMGFLLLNVIEGDVVVSSG